MQRFLFTAALIATTGTAFALNFPTVRILVVPDAPVTIQSCDVADWNFEVQARNRALPSLQSFDVRFQAFDASGKLVSSGTFTYPEVLASGDSDTQKQYNYGKMTDAGNIASMTCRLTSATFKGTKKPWAYGDTWHGKLLPTETPTPTP